MHMENSLIIEYTYKHTYREMMLTAISYISIVFINSRLDYDKSEKQIFI